MEELYLACNFTCASSLIIGSINIDAVDLNSNNFAVV